VSALREAGIAVQRTREPGGSPGAEAIRNLLLEGDNERWDAISEAMLFNAARRDHVARLIEPALASGEWVVCDRFTDSTVAYQGYGHLLPLADLAALQRIALGSFIPDLTLILDIAVEDGLSRAGRRSMIADRFERLHHEFHRRLRDGFLDIAKKEPRRCAVIDASGDVATVERAILAAVSERLGVRLG
jgi:dTMP kinase